MDEKLPVTDEIMESIAFFHGLSDNDMRIIPEYLNLVRFNALEYVFKEGDPYGSAYFLLNGSVQILKHFESQSKQQVLAEITKPQMFGELALVSKGNRSASILTLEPIEAVEISSANFERIITKYPVLAVEIMRRIANVISTRLQISNKTLVHLCAEVETSTSV